MSTAEETQDAAQQAADAAEKAVADLAGQLGARRIAGLVAFAQARALQDQAARLIITADLSDAAGKAAETLAQAQARREEAEEALRPVAETISKLEAELTDCQARGANISGVIAEDADLTARIEARSLRLAFEEETADLTERIAMIRGSMLAPLGQDLAEAQAAEGRARRNGEDLVLAAADPLGHPRARETEGFALWMKQRFAGILATGEPRTPGWAEAKAELFALLRSSGIGAEIQTEAIQAYRSGDPAAVNVGGTTTHLPDGSTVVYDPSSGAPPVVSHGRATRQQLDAAPAMPQTDSRPASAVMAAWDQVIQHQTSPGLWQHP